MAYNDTQAARAANLTSLVASAVKAALGTIGTALVSAASANRRLRLVERLSEKSNEELAALGIRREDIVRRVFHDMLDM